MQTSSTAALFEVGSVVSTILQDVELKEPRFVAALAEINGKCKNVALRGTNDFEITLFLNQMGVFNFADDHTTPGYGVLKLSDGRKRSMSLWIEFITASGYLSAKKIRSRFYALFNDAVSKSIFQPRIRMLPEKTDVRFTLDEKYVVEVNPAFRCTGLWPHSARNWPTPAIRSMIAGSASMDDGMVVDGFILLSKDVSLFQQKQNYSDGDAWVISFTDMENKILCNAGKQKCMSILNKMLTPYVTYPDCPVNDQVVRTIVMHESDKHFRDEDWMNGLLSERLNGILLQLIACLKCKHCPHYFLPDVDLFKNCNLAALNKTAYHVWCILRDLVFDVHKVMIS